jgi:hypothetical protein
MAPARACHNVCLVVLCEGYIGPALKEMLPCVVDVMFAPLCII